MRASLQNHQQSGFTLVEILVVISIVGILSSVVLVAINPVQRLAEARDAKRHSDISLVKSALIAFYTTNGRFPTPNYDAAGWDDSNTGVFISELESGGFLKDVPVDPINNVSNRYSYYRYAAGYAGCPVERGAFVVVGIRNLESTSLRAAQQPNAAQGAWSCPGRNWGNEFDHVWGEFEN